MKKRTKLKSNYRKRSKRTRKYSFKKRKNTRKRRKQKGGTNTEDQQLLDASNYGNLEDIQRLVQQEVDINTTYELDNTPLHLASLNGHTKTVKLLLKNGARIDSQNIEGNTPLHLASLNGHTNTVKLLLKNGADLKLQNKEGNNPLHIACKINKSEILELLIKRDITFDARYQLNNVNMDLFHISCYYNSKASLVELLKTLSYPIIRQWPFFFISSKLLDLEKETRYESQYKEHINEITDFEHINYLGLAIWRGHYDIAKLLIQYGAKTTFYFKITFKNTTTEKTFEHVEEFVRYVWKDGSDKQNQLLNLINLGEHLLELLNDPLGNKDSQVIHFLDSHSTNISQSDLKFEKDGYFYNPLGSAIVNNKTSVVEKLLPMLSELKMDINTPDSRGHIPLHLACQQGNSKIVKLLIDNKANISLINKKNGNTPLHEACKSLSPNIDVVKAVKTP